MSQKTAQISTNDLVKTATEEPDGQKQMVYVVIERLSGWGWEAWQAPESTEELISIHKSLRGANDAAITYYKEKVLYDGASGRGGSYVAPASSFVNGLFREVQEKQCAGETETVVEVREITLED